MIISSLLFSPPNLQISDPPLTLISAGIFETSYLNKNKETTRQELIQPHTITSVKLSLLAFKFSAENLKCFCLRIEPTPVQEYFLFIQGLPSAIVPSPL